MTPDDSAAIASLPLTWAEERGDAVENADTYAAGLSTRGETHASSVQFEAAVGARPVLGSPCKSPSVGG